MGFGGDITRRFLEDNSLTGVIRSHEVRQGGYSIEHGGQCITVFSAPNYVGLQIIRHCLYVAELTDVFFFVQVDQVGNLAGVVRIDDCGALSFTTFSAQPHPDIKPMACKSVYSSCTDDSASDQLIFGFLAWFC